MSKITIENGILRTEVGLFRKKLIEIDLSRVEVIVPRKGLIPEQYAIIGSAKEGYCKIRTGKAGLEQILNELVNLNAPVIGHLDMVLGPKGACEKLKKGQSVLMNANNVWMTPEHIVFCPPRRFFMADLMPRSMKINEVLFSTTNQIKKFGLMPTGYSTYFGSESVQAEFKHQRMDEAKHLEEHLKKNGSKIGVEEQMRYNNAKWIGNLIKPSLWTLQESIGFANDGVVFESRKGGKRERLFLPFSEINYVLAKKNFVGSNSIVICGQQNIATKLRFSNTVIQEVLDKLKDAKLSVPVGDVRPTWMLGLFKNPMAKRRLTIFSDKIIYYDSKTNDVISFKPEDVINLAWKKKEFYYLVGYLFFEVHSSNIRKDQNSSTFEFVMPCLWFRKKNTIKSMVGGDYNNRDFRKHCSISDVRYS